MDPLNTEAIGHINTLLQAALLLPPHEREAWLQALPDADPALKQQLADLLARADTDSDDFLRRPLNVQVSDVVDLLPADDLPGQRVGPYALIRELGAGGMGTVWLAERVDGVFKREVALKLPRSGWGLGLAQRMERERALLGALEHPRIARLYDAGVTPSGRPWMAIEYVQGQPIDQYCRERGLSTRERVALVLQVADAVAHAHARLIVHRDLKPSNILVNEAGEVRLLDFGVAKLLGDGPRQRTHLTQWAGAPVTLDYASPEQVGGKPITVATDVYSLGVVLYELLTDRRPYALKRTSPAALEDAILAADAPLASSRVAGQPVRSRSLRGDLDAILAKALQKEPTQRYASIEAMATDLRWHLEGRPVLAQRPSHRYRLGKYLRRHALGLTVIGLVLAAVATGLAVALWQGHEARAQAARAERVKEFMASVFKQAAPRQGAGGVVTATDLLLAAVPRIEAELASEPLVAVELGLLVGAAFNDLGVPAMGETTLRATVARAESLYGPRHPSVLLAKTLLADSIDEQDTAGANRLLDELLPAARAGLPTTATTLVEALYLQTLAAIKRNRLDAALAAVREGVAVGEAHLGPLNEQTIKMMGLQSNIHGRLGQREDMLWHATQALERATALQQPRPSSLMVAMERRYAEALRQNDRPADAVRLLRNVLRDVRALDAAETPRVRHALVQLALALDDAGQAQEGLARMREAVALEARHNPKDANDRVSYLGSLATLLLSVGQLDEAAALDARVREIGQRMGGMTQAQEQGLRLREVRRHALRGDAVAARQGLEGLLPPEGGSPSPTAFDAWAIAALNERLQRRPEQALAWTQRAMADLGWSSARASQRAAVRAEEGQARLDLGQVADAEAALRHALALYQEAQLAPSPRMAGALVGMARVHLQSGRPAQAKETLQPLVPIWEAVNPGGVAQGETLWWWSRAQGQLGEPAAAAEGAARRQLARATAPALRALAAAPSRGPRPGAAGDGG